MLLKVINLSYTLEHKEVLKQVDLEAKAGKITAVLGANGSGKSTLLKLIAGLLDADSGEIRFDNQKVVGPNFRLIPGQPGITLVKQDNRLFPFHTVRQNIRHVLQAQHESFQEEKINELTQLLGLTQNLDRQLKYLSGGEQQRVSIAAALAADPKLLLMDEPFSQTDMYLKQELKDYLQRVVNQLKVALLFVTHDPEDALSMADEIMILDQGRIIEQGSAEGIYYKPVHKATAILTGYCNWLPVNEFKNLGLPIIDDLLLIRPDQIQIHKDSVESSLRAQIEKIEFCGFYRCFFLRLCHTNLPLMVTQISRHCTAQVGQVIWVTFQN